MSVGAPAVNNKETLRNSQFFMDIFQRESPQSSHSNVITTHGPQYSNITIIAPLQYF